MKIHNGSVLDISDRESDSYLQINSCGIQLPSQQEKLTYRRNGRCDYHIVYIAEGTCEVEYTGKSHPLTMDLYYIRPICPNVM